MAEERTDDTAAWAALAELYHRYPTGLLLGMVTRLGTAPAARCACNFSSSTWNGCSSNSLFDVF